MNLQVLGDDGVLRIDRAARQVLERTGVLVPHEEMLALFASAGAAVDRAGGRVRIPSKLVDECVASAGKTFTIYGRARSRWAAFGAGRRNYNSVAGEAHRVHPPSRAVRAAWSRDDPHGSSLDHVPDIAHALTPKLTPVMGFAWPCHTSLLKPRCTRMTLIHRSNVS